MLNFGFSADHGSNQNQKIIKNTGLPGESFSIPVTITNPTDSPQTFQISEHKAEVNKNQQLIFNQTNNSIASNWLEIPETQVTVPANSSQTIPVSLKVPNQTNAGTHHHLLIAKPLLDNHLTSQNSLDVIRQKGIRLQTTVEGITNQKLELLSQSQTTCGNQTCLNYEIKNPNDTDHQFFLNLNIKNIFNQPVNQLSQKVHIPKNSTTTTSFAIDTPLINRYTVEPHISNNSNVAFNSGFQTQFVYFFPTLIILAVLCLSLLFKNQIINSYQKIIKKTAFRKKRTTKQLSSLQKSALSGFIIIISLLIYSFSNFNSPNSIFAQDTSKDLTLDNFLTVQWGNVNKLSLPDNALTKKWHFSISTDSGSLMLENHLDFETSDNTIEASNHKSIEIDSVTENDIDGMILVINKEPLEDPLITFTDLTTNQSTQYRYSQLQNENLFLPGRQSIHLLASDVYYKAKRFFLYTQEDDLNQIIAATGDLPSFLEIPATPQISEAEVRELFELLPATYQAFVELKPSHDLISKIIAASGQVIVWADPILIGELAASPDLLHEIAASPSRNILFTPDRKLIFPKQEFDFEQQKIISIPVQEFLFSDNREGHFTAYLQASDFISLADNQSIPAENLCIMTGEVKWQKHRANNFFTKTKYCFRSNSDQMPLIERYIGKPTTFSIQPTLELKIPKGTPPGKYRGRLTITEI